MNIDAAKTPVVPPAAVTVTGTVPLPAGTAAVSYVDDCTVTRPPLTPVPSATQSHTDGDALGS